MLAKPLSRKTLLPALAVLLLLASAPRFFGIYRTAAFNTVPRDDYAPYLLQIMGEEGGRALGAPFQYRIFPIAAAIPFYVFLPPYKFSLLSSFEDKHLRATQALALTSHVFILATTFLLFLAARRLGASPPASALAALSGYVLFESTNMFPVDSASIFMITLLCLLMKSRRAFVPVMLVSCGFKETVPLLFCLLFAARNAVELFRFRRLAWKAPFAASLASLALYFLIRACLDLPGYENQTAIGSFAPSFADTLSRTLSAKGFALNVLPVVPVLLLYLLALRCPKSARGHFDPADIAALAGLVLAGFAAGIEYSIGRVALFCFPLYLPAAFRALEDGLPKPANPGPISRPPDRDHAGLRNPVK